MECVLRDENATEKTSPILLKSKKVKSTFHSVETETFSRKIWVHKSSQKSTLVGKALGNKEFRVGNTGFISGFKTDRTCATNLEMFEKYCPDGDAEAMKHNGNFVNK